MNYGLAQANMAAIGGGSYNRYSTAGVGGGGSVGNSGMVTSKQGLATSADYYDYDYSGGYAGRFGAAVGNNGYSSFSGGLTERNGGYGGGGYGGGYKVIRRPNESSLLGLIDIDFETFILLFSIFGAAASWFLNEASQGLIYPLMENCREKMNYGLQQANMASGGSFNRFGGGVGLGNGGNGGSPGMVTSKQGLQAASQDYYDYDYGVGGYTGRLGAAVGGNAYYGNGIVERQGFGGQGFGGQIIRRPQKSSLLSLIDIDYETFILLFSVFGAAASWFLNQAIATKGREIGNSIWNFFSGGNEGKGVMDTLKEYVVKFDVMNSLLGDFMDSNEIGGSKTSLTSKLFKSLIPNMANTGSNLNKEDTSWSNGVTEHTAEECTGEDGQGCQKNLSF